MGLLTAVCARGADRQEIIIYPGISEYEQWLGFGWSRHERHPEGMVRWISHMEADISFVPEKSADLRMELKAAPLYVSWRRQRVGFYINGRYLTDWLCPAGPELTDFVTTIPADMLTAGTNTLTLRMAYRLSIPPDERKLSLLVHTLRLTSEE
ncbi:MAG: hypothetical protein EOM20_18150 [Spartobacteria bacterium]|nr:hypothetical protein [Spartobacteria bacterium]